MFPLLGNSSETIPESLIDQLYKLFSRSLNLHCPDKIHSQHIGMLVTAVYQKWILIMIQFTSLDSITFTCTHVEFDWIPKTIRWPPAILSIAPERNIRGSGHRTCILFIFTSAYEEFDHIPQTCGHFEEFCTTR